MSRPSIGKWLDGGAAVIDLATLLQTRMLITATSGQGKSRALRRLLEQLAGTVQMLIIDPEGEFASLREKHDLVICAATGGDAAAHPRTAALLARRLRECKASAVLDLSELKPDDRHRFVKLFLEALVDCPRALWDPCLVVLDEAQMFAPEKGQGQSEATSAVIDVAARGRKRGLCLVAATLRVSMLDKSVCAELRNRLIGGTSMDTDVKRLSFDLGMSQRDALAALKPLERGHFLSYGPALNQRDARELVTGDVFTTHPEVGQKGSIVPPAPTRAILALLPKLADLPKEAEQEARTLDDMKRELAQARRDLTLAKNAKPGPSPQDLKAAEDRGFARGVVESSQSARRAAAASLKALRGALRQGIDTILDGAEQGLKEATSLAATAPITPRAPGPSLGKTAAPIQRPAPRSGNADASIGTSGGKYRIMVTLAQHGRMNERRLAILADLSSKGGTWGTYLSALRTAGYIEGSAELEATDAGLAALGSYDAMPTGDALIQYWRGRIGGGRRLAIFNALVEAYPNAVDQDDLAQRVNLSSAGGTWGTYLSSLRTMELITGKKELRAAEELFS